VATETDGDVTTAYEDTCVHTTTAYFRVLPRDCVILDDESYGNDLTLAQQCQNAANLSYAAQGAAETAQGAAVAAKEEAVAAKEEAVAARSQAQIAEQNALSSEQNAFNSALQAGEIESELNKKYSDFTNQFTGENGLIKNTEKACDSANEAAVTAQEKVEEVENILGDLTNLGEVLKEIIAIQDDLIDGIPIYVLPEVTQDTEGHVLVAENGAYTLKAVADMEVDTYIDERINEYINDALGGEY
jgi:hypothetical protein